jgi:hypothetical protein
MRYVSPASNNGSLSINNTSCLSDQTDTGSRPLAGQECLQAPGPRVRIPPGPLQQQASPRCRGQDGAWQRPREHMLLDTEKGAVDHEMSRLLRRKILCHSRP